MIRYKQGTDAKNILQKKYKIEGAAMAEWRKMSKGEKQECNMGKVPHQVIAKEKARKLSFNVTPELEKFIFQRAKAIEEKPATVIREILEHAMRGEIVIRKRG